MKCEIYCPTEQVYNYTKEKLESVGYRYNDTMSYDFPYLAIHMEDKTVGGNSFARYERITLEEILDMAKFSEIFEVDTINPEINNIVLKFLRDSGLEVSIGFENKFYRYVVIRPNSVRGGHVTMGYKKMSLNEVFAMKFEKPIMIGSDRVEKTSTGIKVGCTNITMAQIEEIYKLAKS